MRAAALSAVLVRNSETRAFLVRCVGAAASLGYGLLLADILTPAAMGQFTVAVSVAVIAATVSKLGLDSYLMRRAAQRPEQAAGITLRCLCAAGLAGALAWALCVWVGAVFRPGAAFGVLLLGIPFLAMGYVLTGLLKAGDFPAAATFLETGAWQSAMCACAMLMGVAGSDSPLVVAIFFATGSALMFLVFLFVAGRLVFGDPSTAWRDRPATDIRVGEVAALAGTSVGNVLMRWSDALWLAWFLDAREVAVYMVCTRLAGGIAFIDHAVNAVAAPQFARLHARGKTAELRRELARACAVSGVWGIAAAAAVIVIGPLVLNWLGPPYSAGTGLLRLAAAAMAAQVAFVPIAHLAIMSGRAADYFKATALGLTLQQAAFLLLIPEFGMVAALFGFALARIFVHLFTLALLRPFAPWPRS